MKNNLTLPLCLAWAALMPLAAHAQTSEMMPAASMSEAAPLMLKPVMIIRFNQPRVYFEKQLATIIRRAVQTKADVVFDVIQYIPAQARSADAYQGHLQAVLKSFASSGVAETHVQAEQQPSADVATDEIYIFVR